MAMVQVSTEHSWHWVVMGFGREHEEVHKLWPALFPLSKILGVVKSQRTRPLNSMSLLMRKKPPIWLKAVNLTKLYLKKVMTASTVQLWTDALSESPSEVTRLQRKGYILMQPFNFSDFITEHIQRKRILARVWTFFMFSQGGKEGKGRQLEANWDAQREKLPIKTAEITGAPSDTLAHALADKREPSAKHIPVLF